jgi:hypothetical protein
MLDVSGALQQPDPVAALGSPVGGGAFDKGSVFEVLAFLLQPVVQVPRLAQQAVQRDLDHGFPQSRTEHYPDAPNTTDPARCGPRWQALTPRQFMSAPPPG